MRRACAITRPWRIIPALALAAWLLACGPALAQWNYVDRNAFTPAGQQLTVAMVRDELERRMQLNPRNEASLWNTGYDFYRNFPKNQDTANAIHLGFLRARPDTPEQGDILRKGAIYWQKIHNYGVTNVAVAHDPNTREKIYYGSTAKQSTLIMSSPGAKHRPQRDFRNFDWPGRNLEKRAPYKGRPDNPYPGKYYPGMYPP